MESHLSSGAPPIHSALSANFGGIPHTRGQRTRNLVMIVEEKNRDSYTQNSWHPDPFHRSCRILAIPPEAEDARGGRWVEGPRLLMDAIIDFRIS